MLATAFAMLLVLLSASRAFAEVMDKEPTIRDMWESAILLGLAGAAAWLWNKWAGMIVFLFAVFFAWGRYLELSDPFVGPEIVREAGPTYVRHAYAAMAVTIAPHIGGLILRLKERGLGSQARESA
jgi:hypothetical protein